MKCFELNRRYHFSAGDILDNRGRTFKDLRIDMPRPDKYTSLAVFSCLLQYEDGAISSYSSFPLESMQHYEAMLSSKEILQNIIDCE